MTYDPNFIEVRESEYDGDKHFNCPDCGEIISSIPCIYCEWEKGEDEDN